MTGEQRTPTDDALDRHPEFVGLGMTDRAAIEMMFEHPALQGGRMDGVRATAIALVLRADWSSDGTDRGRQRRQGIVPSSRAARVAIANFRGLPVSTISAHFTHLLDHGIVVEWEPKRRGQSRMLLVSSMAARSTIAEVRSRAVDRLEDDADDDPQPVSRQRKWIDPTTRRFVAAGTPGAVEQPASDETPGQAGNDDVGSADLKEPDSGSDDVGSTGRNRVGSTGRNRVGSTGRTPSVPSDSPHTLTSDDVFNTGDVESVVSADGSEEPDVSDADDIDSFGAEQVPVRDGEHVRGRDRPRGDHRDGEPVIERGEGEHLERLHRLLPNAVDRAVEFAQPKHEAAFRRSVRQRAVDRMTTWNLVDLDLIDDGDLIDVLANTPEDHDPIPAMVTAVRESPGYIYAAASKTPQLEPVPLDQVRWYEVRHGRIPDVDLTADERARLVQLRDLDDDGDEQEVAQ